MRGRIEHELLRRAELEPSSVAIVDGASYTYAELARRAGGIAAALRSAGVAPGDRVAVLIEKSLEQVAAIYGGWLAGAIVVPVHDVLRSRQIAHALDHSGARVLIACGRPLLRLAPELLAGRRVIDPREARAQPPPAPDLRGGSEPALILYTSGSTGRPKGILVSHENLRAGARIVSRYLDLRSDERILSVLPFAFDYGLNQLLCAVHRGATLVLARSRLMTAICEQLRDQRITALAGVPPLWAQLMSRLSPLPLMPLPHLRLITNSGGTFPVELIRRYRAHLPHTRIFAMYGLTEAFRSSYLPPEEIDRRPTSIGRAIPETQLYVVGDDGREVGPRGGTGELVHAGPTVALGYWNDPEATARVFRPHPWHPEGPPVVYSGDRVRRDADGYLYFVGRRDHMLKCHGYRVSPDEIEEVVYASGLVDEAAVSGEPDPIAGTRVVVHVVAREQQPDLERRLLAHCRRELPRYMMPARVVVRDRLPRTPSGKLDRRRLAA
ncbi:MAG TPA: AMP-binding protein [Sandaracinaceae bacterium]